MSVAQAILVCAVQNIALRGHREGDLVDEESKPASIGIGIGYNYSPRNYGNFLEILHVVSAHDPIVEQRLLHGPKNRNILTTASKVEILSILAQMIRTDLETEIQKRNSSL